MAEISKGTASFPKFCAWCYGPGTNRCGHCHSVYYCSRDHQMQHWSMHKTVCIEALPPMIPVDSDQPSTSSVTFAPVVNWDQSNMPIVTNEGANNQMFALNIIYNPNNSNVSLEKPLNFDIPDDEEIFSSITSELLSSDNNFWGLINPSDTQNLSNLDLFLEKNPVDQVTEEQSQALSPFISNNETISSAFIEDVNLMQCASLNDICTNVIHDLNMYGICVLDKFIGSKNGNVVLQEVKNLYSKGIFKKGEIVNPWPFASKENIRRDVTTWVNGTEPDCNHIGNLMKKLDVVLTTCNKMPNNGLLSKYKLHRRTKAMVACYPGDGTYYKKHIDNPHKDGRCITCIYYLNQNWDTKVHGGLLRMFPAAHDSQVANIEPIFDRMIFFWSDKRNPHEVLPSYDTRFAITVWYFDADERDQALKMSRERALTKSRNQPLIN